MVPSSSPGGAALTIDRKVESEMTRLLYRSAGFGLFSNFILALLLVAGTFQALPRRLHLVWLGTTLAISFGQWGLNLASAHARPPLAQLPRWRLAFLSGVVLAGRALPIIALTANVRPEDRDACAAAGMDDFLAKPVRQEQLRACLEKWLARPAALAAQ